MLRAFKATPVPVLLLVASFLCPTEFSLYLDSLRLPPHRIALILLFPIALYRLFLRPGLRVHAFDILFVLFAAWTAYVYSFHAGQEGFVYGGSLALESLGGYLVARAWVRDADTFAATLKVMTAAIGLAALIALPETLFGQTFTHDFLAGLTGYKHPTGVETRMGLTRAYGTFDHPIHYGTFCAAFLALFWYSERHQASRNKKVALVAAATLLGLSSAPLLCIGLQTAMLVWERATRGVALRTAMTVAVLVGLYIGASLVSNRSPINLIATGMTLDAWTGFYRLQIWENGLDNVWGNPLFGIGLAEWDRPKWMVSSTVDAFWLVTAMRSGIPAFLLVVSAILLLGRAVVTRAIRSRDRDLSRIAMGWMMSLIAMSLIACTVHYWNVLHTFFFFFLGLAGWLADPKRGKIRAKAPLAAAPVRQRRPVPRSPQPVYGAPVYGAYGLASQR